jgi:hypothetical protein
MTDLTVAQLAQSDPKVVIDTLSGISIETRWWGFIIVMDDNITTKIYTGGETVAGVSVIVAGSLATVGAPGAIISVLAGGLAAATFAKSGEMKVLNNGHGVYWPITWLQLAALIGSAAGGPGPVVAAALLVIHPWPNDAPGTQRLSRPQPGWSNWDTFSTWITAENGTVTATEIKGIISLFMVGTDGNVNTSARLTNGQKFGPWSSVSASVKSLTGAHVEAITHAGTDPELFRVDIDGTVWMIAQSEGEWDSSWTALRKPMVVGGGGFIITQPDGKITAINRDKDYLDLFLAGKDGTIWTIARNRKVWDAAWTGIQKRSSVPGSSIIVTLPGGAINAFYRNTDHLDLFIAAADGTVWTIARKDRAWDATWSYVSRPQITTPGGAVTVIDRGIDHGDRWDIDGWKPIAPAVKALPGTRIAAAYRDSANPTSLDVFITALDGTMQIISRKWNPSDGSSVWQREWTAINPAFKSIRGNTVSLNWQYAENGTACVVGRNGLIFVSDYWAHLT